MPTSDPTTIQAATGARSPLAAKTRDPKLDAVCKDFEGLLLGTILKQGLSSGLDDPEDGDNTAMLTEFAAEQTARELGQAGTLGIADLLYEQLSGRLPPQALPAPPAGKAP